MSSQAEPSTETANHASIIVASDYRKAVCAELLESPATPTTLAEAVDIEVAHTSRALQELKEKDLVTLMVDEARNKGRIYKLTESGRKAAEFATEL